MIRFFIFLLLISCIFTAQGKPLDTSDLICEIEAVGENRHGQTRYLGKSKLFKTEADKSHQNGNMINSPLNQVVDGLDLTIILTSTNHLVAMAFTTRGDYTYQTKVYYKRPYRPGEKNSFRIYLNDDDYLFSKTRIPIIQIKYYQVSCY